MGFFLKTLRCCVIFFILAGIFVNIPNLPPNGNFEEFRFQPAPSFDGPLSVNQFLNKGERLFENEIQGPEGLAVHKNVLYTGLADGRVVALKNNKLVTIVDLSQPSDDKWDMSKKGRLLGLEFDKSGNLFVVDCFYGIYKVNVTTGASSLVVPSNKPIAGQLPLLPDDIAIGADGSIYWSDASTKFPLHLIIYSMLGDTSGRLIKTNPKTGQSEVLISNLRFANGVFLAHDESYVAVAETLASRIHRYWLKGPKKGKAEVFIDNLPGYPDNLSPRQDGGFVVNLLASRESPDLIAALAPFPNVRKFFARVLALIELALQSAYNVYPADLVKRASQSISHIDTTTIFLLSKHYIALIYNKDGKLTSSLHSTDGSLPLNSDLVELDGYYYLGSPWNAFLGRKKVSTW